MSYLAQDGVPVIGYIDLGLVAVPRVDLAESLPDIERFERCLPDAKRLHTAMSANGGRVPAFTGGWPESHWIDVEATFREATEILKAAREEIAAPTGDALSIGQAETLA